MFHARPVLKPTTFNVPKTLGGKDVFSLPCPPVHRMLCHFNSKDQVALTPKAWIEQMEQDGVPHLVLLLQSWAVAHVLIAGLACLACAFQFFSVLFRCKPMLSLTTVPSMRCTQFGVGTVKLPVNTPQSKACARCLGLSSH